MFWTTTNLFDYKYLNGFTDSHCHILPGVDDGVKTEEEAFRILKQYEDLGFKQIWFTPHIMEDCPNKTADLRDRFNQLKEHYTGNLQLNLAAEYMADSLFIERIEQQDLLPHGERQDMILVETSTFNPPAYFDSIIESIKRLGFFPLLAHPERYIYMDDKQYDKLKNQGVKFQLNLGSLCGLYGEEVQQKARKLLKKGYYDLRGTDIHSERWLARPWIAKKKDIQLLLNMHP